MPPEPTSTRSPRGWHILSIPRRGALKRRVEADPKHPTAPCPTCHAPGLIHRKARDVTIYGCKYDHEWPVYRPTGGPLRRPGGAP